MQQSEIINDNRMSHHFKTNTFSNYLKKDVFSEFLKSIKSSNIETSCHWGVELHCSGYLDELWEKIIVLSSIIINTAVPKFTSYIFNRYKSYLEEIGVAVIPDSNKILASRNNNNIRYQLCEVICMLTTSKKRELNKMANIRQYELDINWIKLNKKLIETMYTTPTYIKKNDSPNIHIMIYQFAQYISYSKKDIHNAIYWMSWLIEWDTKNKSNAQYNIESRKIIGMDEKYQKDIVWVLWEIIIHETNSRNNESLTTQIKALYQLYKFRFSLGKRKTRIPLMIHSISLLSLNLDWNQHLTDKQDTIKQVCVQINKLYYDISSGCLHINDNKMNTNNYINNNTHTTTKTKKKDTLSDTSQKKLDAFNLLSQQMLYKKN